MSIMSIAIGASAISLILVIIWMISLSAKKKREEAEKSAREEAYRKAMQAAKEREHQERIYKAETGNVATQLFLAKEAEKSSPREAMHWYEKAAKADNEIGMYSLVRMCEKFGKDNVLLKMQAAYWKNVIKARSGDKMALFEVGLCLLKGKGIDQDIEKGIGFIEEVAEADILDAQLYMGDWCVAESNPNPNPVMAAEWNYRAARQNSTEGMIRLGRHYAEGHGVEKSVERATYWLELASETGDAKAQFAAGEFWASQEELEYAEPLAYIWFFLSAQSGYERAKKRRDSVANKIDISAVVALQGIAKPILARMSEGKVRTHSIIKALNKMYKRPSYFPDIDGNEFMVGEPVSAEPEDATAEGDSPETEAGDNPPLDFSQPMGGKDAGKAES